MEYKRVSRYYPGEDGTLLAVDIYLPGTQERVPFLMKAGYDRRRQHFERDKAAIEGFLAAGYAVAIAEVRGAGASFGVSDGFFGPHDGKDLKAVIDAIAKEPWCNGCAGMFGGSNYGMSQEITAAEQPEALKAVCPGDCSMDFYDQDFPNGASALPESFGSRHHQEEAVQDPVDDDTDGSLRDAAVAAHAKNLPFLAQHVRNMYRDDVNPLVGYRPNIEVPAWERMDAVRFGHIRPFLVGSWFDPGCTNKILSFKSWGGKLVLGPWPHCGMYRGANYGMPGAEYDWQKEHLRWFDRQLKGAGNDIEEEPAVRYYTVGDAGREWKYEEDFPVEGTVFAGLHLGKGAASGAAGAEAAAEGREAAGMAAGSLSGAEAAPAELAYQVRNDVMIYGRGMRMDRNVTKDMGEEDAKSLCFTSEPMPEDLEITGVPVLELYVKSTHPDGNFIAALEEVTPDGVSHFITEGVIRASHAKVHRNPTYDSMGLPYHRGFRTDRVEIPAPEAERPLKLAFHLEALSRVVKKGSRIRLAISCGGSGYQQPEGFPAGTAGDPLPTVYICCGKGADSRLVLPVVKPWETHFADGGRELWLFKTAVFIKENGTFRRFAVRQVYPAGRIGEERYIYETEGFDVLLEVKGGRAAVELKARGGEAAEAGAAGGARGAEAPGPARSAAAPQAFTAEAPLPKRHVPAGASPEIPLPVNPWAYCPKTDRSGLYVATVPVPKGVPGNMNPMQRKSFDLFIDLIYPKKREGRLPVIVNVHGFGGSHHNFERTTEAFLERGFAVASIDYRLTPPCTGREPVQDAKGCIRYLKAHADELGLDPERIGIAGGSMGGYITGMIAADNGAPAFEGTVGGNTDFDSSVKASVTGYGPMDLMTFGDDCEAIWPDRPEKRANGDGPFAPPASMTGYVGPGKGIADLKKHMADKDPEYVHWISVAAEMSPISHVTERSAPICLIHGIFDCPIQVPMGQSVRMFEAYTKKGVKALLLCNNNGMYGDDPEVKDASVRFLADRV